MYADNQIIIDGIDLDTAVRLAEFFQAMSDPSRVRIIFALLQKERNVAEIASVVGISDSAISHHLRGLRQMRLVKYRKVGRQVFYSLDDEHVNEIILKGLDHILHP